MFHQRRQVFGFRSGVVDPASQDWADENSIRRLIRARSHEEEGWRSEFSGFQLLVTGTLVWGFGDLIGPLIG